MDKEQLEKELSASKRMHDQELQKVNLQLAFMQGRIEGLLVALEQNKQPLYSQPSE